MRWTLLLVTAGCFSPVHDLDRSCTLVRAGPDGGAEAVLNTDPEIAYGANQDIISFGGTDCSTRICVRDAQFRQAAGDGPALGYCSMACGPCPEGMTCRALLLDEQTLRALKAADPERYRAVFGEATRPYFCAR